MTPEQFELFYVIKKRELPFEERYNAAFEIRREVGLKKVEENEIHLFYEAMVEFWRSLGVSKTDREDPSLFDIRRRIAIVCLFISMQLPEGQKFFRYYPKVHKAEGIDTRMNKMKEGVFKTGYGSSLYEFHLEYPIEGIGIKKDLISVITADNRRIPMLEWCQQNDIVVYCSRCGLEITQEVSKDCPFMKRKFRKRT